MSTTQNEVRKWNSEIPWTHREDYILRVTEESFGPSKSSGNPMITLKMEVVSPETMEVAGAEYNIAGVSFGLTKYYPTQVIEDGETNQTKTVQAQDRVKELYRAFGLDDSSINFENPTLGFKGKTVYARLYNNATEQRRAPTKEQLAKGQRQGDIMTNPVTKKPLMQNSPAIGEIFGLAPTDGNKPY
jgi:hypothetical protein